MAGKVWDSFVFRIAFNLIALVLAWNHQSVVMGLIAVFDIVVCAAVWLDKRFYDRTMTGRAASAHCAEEAAGPVRPS